MRKILKTEICNEKPNSSALGAVNEVLKYKDSFGGKEYTFKLGKNKYGVTVANRYENGKKTNYSQPLSRVAENLRKYK